MTKSRVFIICNVGFAVGIFLQSQFHLSLLYILPCLGLFVLVGITTYRSRIQLSVYVVFFICIILGALRLSWSLDVSEYEEILNTKQKLNGIVGEDIDIRPDRQQIRFRPEGFQQNLLLITDKNRQYFYGDWLLVEGKITEPKPNADFDYRAYLQRFNTYGIMQRPKIIVLRQRQGNWLVHKLLVAKHAFMRQVNKVLPETESNLLLGILIGARKGLPEAVTENFSVTGVSHIIAISGYNISIIAASLSVLDRYIGRRKNFWFTIALILSFVIMSGASASVVRAALMGGLFLLSGHSGRPYSITPSLCLAAGLMLAVNPRILYWDVGFQLSFLATVGLVYFAPLLESLTENWPKLFGIKTILITTFSAMLLTLPIILYQFGRLSIIAPVANVLILPVVPLTMLFGFLSGIPFFGHGFGLITGWLLGYMLWLTDYLAHVPFANVKVVINHLLAIGLYLIILVAYLLLRYAVGKRNKKGFSPKSPYGTIV